MPGAVVGADDNGDTGQVEFGLSRQGKISECASNRLKRRLGLTITRGQAELPIENFAAAPVPFVGPGKNERTGTTGGTDCAHLAFQTARLLNQTVPNAVEADFTHYKGTAATRMWT